MSEARRLAKHDPSDKGGYENEDAARSQLEADIARLAELQERFAADARYGLVVVLQGLDAAGKDGTIKHVMRGLNPQGVTVHSFREPTHVELAHDYLWRAACVLPERGRISVFNRSYYEEVLVTRVHPELLEAERLPPGTAGSGLWKQRFKQIRRFEHYLHDNGILVRKFFLHISREEQARRLLERIEDPHKHWKLQLSDFATHEQYDAYQHAYEDMLRNTSTSWAPWTVVPADHKWVTHLRVASELVETLASLKPKYPDVPPDQLAAFAEAERTLKDELA